MGWQRLQLLRKSFSLLRIFSLSLYLSVTSHTPSPAAFFLSSSSFFFFFFFFFFVPSLLSHTPRRPRRGGLERAGSRHPRRNLR